MSLQLSAGKVRVIPSTFQRVDMFSTEEEGPKSQLLDLELSNATNNQELVFSTRSRTTPPDEDERKRSRRLPRAEYGVTMIVDDGCVKRDILLSSVHHDAGLFGVYISRGCGQG